MHRDSQPQLCAVRGTGYALDNLDVLKRDPQVQTYTVAHSTAHSVTASVSKVA